MHKSDEVGHGAIKQKVLKIVRMHYFEKMEGVRFWHMR